VAYACMYLGSHGTYREADWRQKGICTSGRHAGAVRGHVAWQLMCSCGLLDMHVRGLSAESCYLFEFMKRVALGRCSWFESALCGQQRLASQLEVLLQNCCMDDA
jgi:hypothetical protein